MMFASDTPGSSGRVGSILERIKAKKAVKRESLSAGASISSSGEQGDSQEAGEGREERASHRVLRGAANINTDNINTHVQR